MLNLSPFLPADGALKVLCLGAHSDDIEIGCGGAILALAETCAALSVYWIVFSASEVRAREARVSAAAFLERVAHKSVVVKDYRDGYFPFVGDRIKDDFESLKKELSPDLIFTHYRDDRHQDHRLICNLTWNTFRDHLILEYEIPKYDGDLGQPNLFVPLSEATCASKIDLLLTSFASQRGKQWFDEQTFRAILRLRGLEANSPTRYAEAFHCRKSVLRVDSARHL